MIPVLGVILVACAKTPPTVAEPPAASEGRRVLVIVNGADVESVRLGRYYAEKRGVPRDNIVLLQTSTAEEVPKAQFESEIQKPVLDALVKTKNPVDFLLFIRGVPERVKETTYSIDSLLMSTGLKLGKIHIGKYDADIVENPYFQKSEPFTHAKFGFYLACRLDGYTPADARALVDRALAAKPNKGPFLLDEADNRKTQSFGEIQATLGRAAALLRTKGFQAVLDQDKAFASSSVPLAGYASWGSNDGAYRREIYNALNFLPGAVCETFVSTSGRTFRPTPTGQSLVADLIAQGVTGVKGYVSEPYTFALARADLLFDRYTSGRNLAESFYAASPVTHWKDVVIGDPLCAPYSK